MIPHRKLRPEPHVFTPSTHTTRAFDGATAFMTAPAASNATAPSTRRAAIIPCVNAICGLAAA